MIICNGHHSRLCLSSQKCFCTVSRVVLAMRLFSVCRFSFANCAGNMSAKINTINIDSIHSRPPRNSRNKTRTIVTAASSSAIADIWFAFFREIMVCLSTKVSRINYGTGSKPPLCKGWQRPIRFTPIHPPRVTPCFAMASIMYSEHVGVNLHDGGKSGDIH